MCRHFHLIVTVTFLLSGIVISCQKPSEFPTQPELDYEQLTENSVREFLKFAKTPRPGFHLDKAREYLKDFAEENGWQWVRDSYGNCWFDVPATKGYENYPNFILQGHMDMVCDAAPGVMLDFRKDVGTPHREGNLIWGEHMNLGADNGIGIGMILAIVTSDVGHGPLRCLFTADEEVGMYGASSLEPGTLNSKYLISLDGEQKGMLYRGCAGSITVHFSSSFVSADVRDGLSKVTVKISGLKGGHSGREIQNHRLSASVVTIKILDRLSELFGARVMNINCGSVDNGIAANTELSVAVKSSDSQAALSQIQEIIDAFAEEYPEETIERKLDISDIGFWEHVCLSSETETIIHILKELKYGVLEKDGDHVTKSSNIAPILLKDGSLIANSMMRSDYNEWLVQQMAYYLSIGDESEVTCDIKSGNPAWYSPTIYPMVAMLKGFYAEALGHNIVDYRSQGGVEPSYFCQLRPDLQVTCFGPEINNAHTSKETLHVEDVPAVLKATVLTLQHINELGE